MNVKVQDAAAPFLREAEMSATCRDYGRKRGLWAVSPIYREPGIRRWKESYGRNRSLGSFSPILVVHGLWAKSRVAVVFAHTCCARTMGEIAGYGRFRP